MTRRSALRLRIKNRFRRAVVRGGSFDSVDDGRLRGFHTYGRRGTGLAPRGCHQPTPGGTVGDIISCAPLTRPTATYAVCVMCDERSVQVAEEPIAHAGEGARRGQWRPLSYAGVQMLRAREAMSWL